MLSGSPDSSQDSTIAPISSNFFKNLGNLYKFRVFLGREDFGGAFFVDPLPTPLFAPSYLGVLAFLEVLRFLLLGVSLSGVSMRIRMGRLYRHCLENGTGTKEKKSFAEAMKRERDEAMEIWYEKGGAYCLEWVKENYRTHAGIPLDLRDAFFCDIISIVGNPWIETLTI